MPRIGDGGQFGRSARLGLLHRGVAPSRQLAAAPRHRGSVRPVGFGGRHVGIGLDQACPGLEHARVGLAELRRHFARIQPGQHIADRHAIAGISVQGDQNPGHLEADVGLHLRTDGAEAEYLHRHIDADGCDLHRHRTQDDTPADEPGHDGHQRDERRQGEHAAGWAPRRLGPTCGRGPHRDRQLDTCAGLFERHHGHLGLPERLTAYIWACGRPDALS